MWLHRDWFSNCKFSVITYFQLVNAIALAIQNRGGGPHQSLLDGNRTEKCPTGIATKGTEFDDISELREILMLFEGYLVVNQCDSHFAGQLSLYLRQYVRKLILRPASITLCTYDYIVSFYVKREEHRFYGRTMVVEETLFAGFLLFCTTR